MFWSSNLKPILRNILIFSKAAEIITSPLKTTPEKRKRKENQPSTAEYYMSPSTAKDSMTSETEEEKYRLQIAIV